MKARTIDPFALKGGELLNSRGIMYRVIPGFQESISPCWRDSRWIMATQLTGHPACVGQLVWIKPADTCFATETLL